MSLTSAALSPIQLTYKPSIQHLGPMQKVVCFQIVWLKIGLCMSESWMVVYASSRCFPCVLHPSFLFWKWSFVSLILIKYQLTHYYLFKLINEGNPGSYNYFQMITNYREISGDWEEWSYGNIFLNWVLIMQKLAATEITFNEVI